MWCDMMYGMWSDSIRDEEANRKSQKNTSSIIAATMMLLYLCMVRSRAKPEGEPLTYTPSRPIRNDQFDYYLFVSSVASLTVVGPRV